MADGVRVWQVSKEDSLEPVQPVALDREERLEKWIIQNVSVLEPGKSGLLIIGRQVKTDFKKEIDLLCMNSKGDLVVVELKRDKTPREVTAQALDYASWVKDLGLERIEKIASEYFKDGRTLKEEFEDLFGRDFPETVNEEHSIKIVASEVDDGTERSSGIYRRRVLSCPRGLVQLSESARG